MNTDRPFDKYSIAALILVAILTVVLLYVIVVFTLYANAPTELNQTLLVRI